MLPVRFVAALLALLAWWLVTALLALWLVASEAFAEDLLTGDNRLACEALLCLSSGERPAECNPSLNRYFNISKKKWSDTLKARRDFLKLCPSASEPGMPSLVEAIINGAGKCDAASLNRALQRYITITVCDDDPEMLRCWDEVIIVIDDVLPAYCKTYATHEYTWNIANVNYVGDKMNGGRWVDQ